MRAQFTPNPDLSALAALLPAARSITAYPGSTGGPPGDDAAKKLLMMTPGGTRASQDKRRARHLGASNYGALPLSFSYSCISPSGFQWGWEDSQVQRRRGSRVVACCSAPVDKRRSACSSCELASSECVGRARWVGTSLTASQWGPQCLWLFSILPILNTLDAAALSRLRAYSTSPPSTTATAERTSFGGLKDQDRIFTNIYGRHDPFIKVGGPALLLLPAPAS
jgi:hypothetical protein